MTESIDKTEDKGDMDPRLENLAGYVLGALDSDAERAAVETLIETDSEAQTEFNELSEATNLLAIAVPAVAPPAHLKATILAMAAEDATPSPVEPTPITTEPSKSWWTKLVQTTYAPAAAAAVLALIVAGGLSFQSNQLGNEIDTLCAEIAVESAVVANLKSDLSTTVSDSETRVATMKTEMDQMEDDFGTTADLVVHQEQMVSELATANEALRQAIRDQSWLTYVAMNEDYQLASWLASEQTAVQSNASGLIAVRMVGNEAVFQVHGLPQPQPGKAYTLWLLGNGPPQPVSQCEVSEIGSATVVFLLPAPLQYYSSVAVTQEQVNDVGPDPTGIMVLSAETN